MWEKFSALLANPKVAQKIMEKAQALHTKNPTLREQEQLSGKVVAVGEQIEALAEHLSKIPKGISPDPIYAQMHKMAELKKEMEQELADLRADGAVHEIPLGLKDYRSYCEMIRSKLGREEDKIIRNQLMSCLVQKVEVTPCSFKMYYFVGEDTIRGSCENLSVIAPLAGAKTKKADDGIPSSASASHSSDFFVVNGSKRLINGRGDVLRRNPL